MAEVTKLIGVALPNWSARGNHLPVGLLKCWPFTRRSWKLRI